MTTEKLTLNVDLITPRHMVDFRRETGVSLMGLIETGFDLKGLPDEVIAGVIWIAMRLGGRPDATFDEALDTPFTALDLSEDEAADVDPTSASSVPS